MISGKVADLRGWIGRSAVTGCQAPGCVGKGGISVGEAEQFCKLIGSHFRGSAGGQGSLFPVSARATAGENGLLGNGFLFAAVG